MKNWLQILSSVIKRVVTANLSGEHYWFIEKPEPVEVKVNKHAGRVWIPNPQPDVISGNDEMKNVV